MAMYRQVYRSVRTGELRVYEYPPQPYVDAVEHCRRHLGRAGELRRFGKNKWRAGPNGRRKFHNATVKALIAKGHARIDGDVVRPA